MPSQTKKIIINLKKANSLTKKLIAMAENKEYCIDIMQQNLAAIGLLRSAHQMLLEDHINTCLSRALKSKNDKLKQQMIEEIITLSKFASKMSCNWTIKPALLEKINK